MELSVQTFAPHTGSTFTARTLAGEICLTLTEVTALPRGQRPAHLRDPLSLIFEGPNHTGLLQDNYPVYHPELGEHVWCLTPIAGPIPGVDPNAKFLYQTIFN